MNKITMLSNYIVVVFFLSLSCDNTRDVTIQKDSADFKLNKNLKYENLIQGIDKNLLLKTTEKPGWNGALSRNKEGYFSVRFQMNLTKLADLAIISEKSAALDEYVKTLAYAFAHQNTDGSYQLMLPEIIINDPTLGLPTKADSVSAVAFFSYSLGISLNALEESEWFTSNTEIVQIKRDIESYRSNIEKTLTYLTKHKRTLRETDAEAPNRLFFDAIAFYGLGKYTGSTQAQALGIEFLNSALDLINEEEGYFIEGRGWDSSYNGVAIKVGLELFSMLPPKHPSKKILATRLINAVLWQESRVLPSGEISTAGNTRVFPGGESFLGNEKEVDVEKTVRAFYYFSILTNNFDYKELADKIVAYYQ